MAKRFLADLCELDSLCESSKHVFFGGYRGELFVEYVENEEICIENGVISSCSFNTSNGFGLRCYKNDELLYAHSSDLSKKAVQDAVTTVNSAKNFLSSGSTNTIECTCCNSLNLYKNDQYIHEKNLSEKISYLHALEAAVRDEIIDVVSITSRLVSSWQVIWIAKSNGVSVGDIRPLVRLSVSTVVRKNGNVESGAYSCGGRYGYDLLLTDENLSNFASKIKEQIDAKIKAKPAPAGEFPVVLGNGWTGILLHEAVGHGLEADLNRKNVSVFANKLGQLVASENVNVIDDGTISKRRGSINIDDEGITSSCTHLIENGRLVGYMYDEMNAAIMNAKPTGNGRRESYSHAPIPRMTNTMMLSGDANQEDMIKCVKNGIFAKSFSDGQVDTASGDFVFAASEAYMIEDGKITYPVKGAMLIGNGPEILKRISAVGNDSCLDDGVGTCGKDGQWVPVGVGMPSLLINNITVGGVKV